MPAVARKKPPARKAGKLVTLPKKAAAKAPLQQIGTFNYDRYRIAVGEDPKSKEKRYISPLDLAQEAEELSRSQVRHDRRVDDFASHMFKLAANCTNPEEFRDVCQQIRDETGWGRRSPAPRVWIVYQSAIYQFWKKHNVRPLSEVAAPVMDGGRIQYQGGHVVKQKVRVVGMYQLKQVDRALQLAKRSTTSAIKEAAEPAGELVEQMEAAKASPQLQDAIKRVVWAYAHLDRESQPILCQRVVRLLKEFPTSEAYPEK